MDISEQKILISGIGGFIGLRVAELAIAQGMTVRGLQHSLDKAKKAQKLGAEVIVGSITDPATAEIACRGVDIVLHTAAKVTEGGSLDEFREVNVGGTLNMALAAKKAGVKTFVHLSSVMVYGFNYPDHVMEDGPLSSENNPYCQTKIEAEEALLLLNAPPDFGIIIIRPGDVYGPGSIPWIIRPLQLMRRGLFALPTKHGVINHVYVDNLIDGIFLAIKKQAYGEIFNITDGQQTSWQEYFTHLAKIAELPAPISLPKEQIRWFLWMRQNLRKFLRQEADILPDVVDFMSRPYAYSIAKAQNILTYEPKISLEEGMRRTQKWLQETNPSKLVQTSSKSMISTFTKKSLLQ
jgi:nucleoside-diphosphate-sugar epimerase